MQKEYKFRNLDLHKEMSIGNKKKCGQKPNFVLFFNHHKDTSLLGNNAINGLFLFLCI